MENSKLTRLNKYLSEVGYCSRREADKLIDQGRVTVNGNPLEKGVKVSNADEVRVDGELIKKPNEDHVYLAFNKPVGIVCTTASNEKDNIVDFINYPKRIFPIGRLDKPSEGLILLTSDGDIVNKILRARNNHEKEYVVTVDRLISPLFIKRMGNGIPILDTTTRKCEVEQLGKYDFRIVLTQGLNRQIRRMCEYLGYDVIKLKRVRIMNVPLDVPVGEWRYLSESELNTINEGTDASSNTEEASLPKQEKKVRSSKKPASYKNSTSKSQNSKKSSSQKPRDKKRRER